MKRQILPPHTPPPDSKEFLASLTPTERALHELAQKHVGLGSSYFMEKSHGYYSWKQSKQSNQSQKK